MPPADADLTEPTSGTWNRAAGGRWLVALAIALLAVGFGLRWLAETNTDLPPLEELLREGRGFYLPALRGETVADALRLNQAPGARAWALTWLRANGRWDARVLATANLAVLVVGLCALGAMLGRGVPVLWRIGLGLGVVALVVLVPIVPRPGLSAIESSGLIALSLLHLGGMSRLRPRPWSTALGFVCGLVNVIAATPGIASAVALVIWALVRGTRNRPKWREQKIIFVLNVALVGLGIGLAVTRSSPAGAGADFFESFQQLTAWPLECPGWALVIWAPAVLGLVLWCRRHFAGQRASEWTHGDRGEMLIGETESRSEMLALLALWAIAQVALLAALQGFSPDAAAEILGVALIVNAACFSFLPENGWKAPVRNQLLVGLWIIVLVNALLYPSPEHAPAKVLAGPPVDAPVTAALRRAAFEGDADPLRATGAVSEAESQEWLRLFSEKELRSILPGGIQPPLGVGESANASGDFLREGAPPIPGRDELPVWGTWSATTVGAATGDFVSEPLETKAAFVQIRIAGELRPPATSLVLRTAEGAEVAPLEGSFLANSRWKRVNIAAPRGPFQIVAHDASATAWLAFTAPQEIGCLTWFAGKLVRTWAWWLAAGLVLGAAACGLNLKLSRESECHLLGDIHFAGRSRGARLVSPPARIAWALMPWLALTAYAVFFSHHIDGTAGPNDSGGYLSSAKVLLQGHVTAAPRTIFGASAGETDITPYLPTTFQPTADGGMAPEYPVGFPLEICALAKLTSLETAVPVLTLLQLVLGVLFTQLLARAMGLSNGWAWLAGGIIGLSPVYLFQALQPQSDGPALVWTTAAAYWAWTSREKPWHALLAGAATALAVMIRPSNVLVVLPILIGLAGRWRQLAGWVIAGVPFAIWQLWYNRTLYGDAFRTGYGELSANFALHYAPLTLQSYVRWLPVMFTPVVVLAALAPFLSVIPGRVRAMLVSWVVVFMGFYTFYWCTYDNWYNMRFVLPAAPALVILGLLVVRWLTERGGFALFSAGPTWRTIVPSVLLAGGLWGIEIADTTRREVIFWMHANRNYAVAGEWARTHFPADAVVFAKPLTGPLMYYTDLVIVRSDHDKAQSSEFFTRIARTGRPIFAVTSHWEQKDFKWGAGRGTGYPNLRGDWERLASLCDGEILTWKWHPASGRPE